MDPQPAIIISTFSISPFSFCPVSVQSPFITKLFLIWVRSHRSLSVLLSPHPACWSLLWCYDFYLFIFPFISTKASIQYSQNTITRVLFRRSVFFHSHIYLFTIYLPNSAFKIPTNSVSLFCFNFYQCRFSPHKTQDFKYNSMHVSLTITSTHPLTTRLSDLVFIHFIVHSCPSFHWSLYEASISSSQNCLGVLHWTDH